MEVNAMTYNVKMMIKNETEKDNTVAATIAKLMGYKDRNTLYKFLNEPERSCLKFAGLVAVVKEYFGDIEFNVITDYAKSLPTYSKGIARCLLEYANMNRLDELQAYLINKMSSPLNSSAENRDWAKIYQLDIDVQAGKEDVLDELNTFDSRFAEPMAYKNILKLYYYYDNQHISILKEYFPISKSSISKIAISAKSDEYIKNSYTMRLALLKMGSYISNLEFDKCREKAVEILSMNPDNRVKTVSLMHLGNTYLFENYEKGMECLKKGLELAIETKSAYEDQIKRSINFLNVYWNKQVSFITNANCVTDLHNTIHNFINKGDLEKAEKALKGINYESITTVDQGFHKYYEGIITGNKDFLYESAFNFKMAGKKNYCQLPLSKLKALGDSEMQLKLYVS